MKQAEIALQLEIATELLQSKRYEQLIEHLSQLDQSKMPPAERAHFALLWSEAKHYLGCYDYEHILSEALAFYKRSNENNIYGRAKYLHGVFLKASGDFLGAKEALLEAYVYAKRCDNYAAEARALNRLGFICYHTGDFEGAVNYLHNCIQVLSKSGDSAQKDVVMLNLSQLYFALGRVSDSLESYKSLTKDAFASYSKNVVTLFLESAIPHALKGDFKTAKTTIAKARPYLDSYVREQAIYFENLGWIHLLEEDHKRAEKALLDGLKISLEIAPQSALVSQIKRRLADACLGQKRLADARCYADEALVVAEKINERVEIAACWRAFGRLDAATDSAKAGDWFRKAIDMFAMIGSRYELAATRYLAAVSGLYHNGRRQALLYLAREYFAGEEVAFMVEKIDREISRGVTPPPVTAARPVDENAVFIAAHPRTTKIRELAEHIAASDMTVLLTGPTGSGKDQLARYIHYHSGRAGRFVPVNCAAIPDNLVESELFGCRKGSFTGAQSDRPGLVETADRGTLYLNEIAEATPEFQGKLLEILESRTIRRLGSTESKRIDFRVIAATNKDIETQMKAGQFRNDLYYRLSEIPIFLPPLSDRPEDITALTMRFLQRHGIDGENGRYAAQTAEIASLLAEHDWPGNVRELRSHLDRLLLLARGNPDVMLAAMREDQLSEKDLVLRTLDQTGWNRRETARILGLSEGAVRKRITRFGLLKEA